MIKVDVCYRRSSLSKYNLIVLFWQQQPVDVNQIIKKILFINHSKRILNNIEGAICRDSLLYISFQRNMSI